MKGFLSIITEKTEYSCLSLSTLNDEVKFDKGNIVLDWYNYIKHIINNMIVEVVLHSSIKDFLENNNDMYIIRYFSVEKEEFLTHTEYLNLSFLEKKSIMEVIVEKKTEKFKQYKDYIKKNNILLKEKE